MSSSSTLQKKVLLSQQVSKKLRFHHVRNHPTSVLSKQQINISYISGSKFQMIQIKIFQRSKARQSNILSIFYPQSEKRRRQFLHPWDLGVQNGLYTKTSQELRMLSRSLSDCKSLLLNVMIQVSQFVSNSQLCH